MSPHTSECLLTITTTLCLSHLQHQESCTVSKFCHPTVRVIQLSAICAHTDAYVYAPRQHVIERAAQYTPASVQQWFHSLESPSNGLPVQCIEDIQSA